MTSPNPHQTIKNLIEAINRSDLDTALSYYEPEAILIAQPGTICLGKDAIRTALEGFIALKPELKGQAHKIIDVGNLALYCSRWTLIGTSYDGKRVEMSGMSSDVLRRQPDGRWLVAIDNPWGTSIID